jgi:hypothetical protein
MGRGAYGSSRYATSSWGSGRIVLAFRDLIGFGTKGWFRRLITGQCSGCEWTVWNRPNLLLAAERQHLSLLFAVDEDSGAPASRQGGSAHVSQRRAAPSGTATNGRTRAGKATAWRTIAWLEVGVLLWQRRQT